MGIPSFYRWLVKRYPLAITYALEEAPDSVNGVSVPVDSSRPNPNDIEFDNLYLDMNGIIHPCFHPEGVPAPETYEDVFKAVFKYIDRIFSIVRPRKLLYMAIDGVAPRAKMNQQRARRFRAAKDAADEASKTESLKGVQESEGHDLEQTKKLDSNVITPGTEFMSLLSSALRYYVHMRMNTDPGWRGIKVILSDANVPGEGEHKIMSYIRLQRNLPGFDPNTRHCLYGLDADLIMLALTTHEIHFSILREDVRQAYTKDRWSTNKRQGKEGQTEQEEMALKTIEDYIMSLYYQFLHVWTLRDYLVHDLSIPDPTADADLERLIDDFVFMCIFVGNDFLPNVPSLEISEGAIDLLMVVYKKEFVHMGGYLTNSFEVNLKRVEHFIQAVSSHENAILMKRSQVQRAQEIRYRGSSNRSGVKKIQSSINHATEVGNPVIDKVKLGEEGWKERYYAEKFEANTNDDCEKIRKQSVLKYIEGICWVMHYYYQGVCSWQWFYPYHYAPVASDFYGLDQLEIHFTLGKPFKPLDQLMGVLPAASAHALPFFYQKLMTDSSSPILDFYPLDFELDQNGKRFLWQAVCKLPFIKESRLLLEIAKVEHTLTDEEKRRNSLGLDMLFIHKSHPLSMMIFSCWKRNKDNPKLLKAKVKRKINPEVSDGMNGYIYISDEDICPLEIGPATDDMIRITKNEVVSVFYKYPSFHPHIPKPPEGVNIPAQCVRKQDVLPPPVLWHDKRSFRGRIYSERPIPDSISGSRLEKLAHQLVCKYYLAKQQGSHIVSEDLACEPNLKVAVSSKELDKGNGESRRKKKQKLVSGSKESISIGVDLASQSNMKAAVSGKVLEAGSAVEPEKKKQGSQVYKGNGSHIVFEDLACEPNLKVTVSSKELDAGSVVELEKKKQGSQVRKGSGSHIVFEDLACEPNLKAAVSGKVLDAGSVVEQEKQKQGSQVCKENGTKESVSIGADLASQSNLKAAVSGKVLDAGSAVEQEKKKQGSQVCKENGSHIVADDLACEPNLKVTVGSKEEPDEGKGESRRQKKRKRVSGSKESVSIGADLASQSNLKAAVSGKVLDAGSGVEQEKQKQGSQVCKENGTKESVSIGADLASQSNLKAAVSRKVLDAGSVVEQEKQKQGSQVCKENGSHIVADDLACEPNLKVTVGSKEEPDEGKGESRRQKKRKRVSGFQSNLKAAVGRKVLDAGSAVEPEKQKQGSQVCKENGTKESVSIGADLASQSNLKAAVSGKVLDAGSAVEPEKKKQGSQVCKENGSHIVADDLACEPNLKVTVGSKEEPDEGKGESRRQKKRKRVSGFQSNLKAAVGGKVLDAGSAVEPEKQKQGSQVCKENGSHIVGDDLACEPNSKVTVGGKEEPDEGKGESRRQRRRKRVSGSKESASIGADLASQSNLKAAVGGKVLDAGSAVELEKQKQGSQVCKENGSHIGADLASRSNLKAAVGGKVLDAGSAVEPEKQKQGSQVCKENGSHIGSDLASRSNLKAAVGGKVLDAGSAVEPEKQKQGSQVCKENGSHIGSDLASRSNLKAAVGGKVLDAGSAVEPEKQKDDLACEPNSKVTVGGKEEPDEGKGESRRQRRRKRVSGSKESASIGADLASQSNLKAAVGGKVLDAGSAVELEKQKQGSQVCKENGSHIGADLASQSNLKAAVGGKVMNRKNRNKEAKSARKMAATVVEDLACESNLKVTVSSKELDEGNGDSRKQVSGSKESASIGVDLASHVLDAGSVVEPGKKKRKKSSASMAASKIRKKIKKAKRKLALANQTVPMEPSLI